MAEERRPIRRGSTTSGRAPSARTDGVRLLWRALPPAAALAPWVARFFAVRAVTAPEAQREPDAAVLNPHDPMLRYLLPNGDENLLFDLGRPGGWACEARPRDPDIRALAIGVIPDPVRVRFGAGTDLLGVAFVPGRARPFLPAPAPDLAGRIVGLGDSGDGIARDLARRLCRLPTTEERIAALERELVRHAPAGASPDPDLDALIAHVLTRGGNVRVRTLARNAGLSRQRFTRWFTGRMGIGPKSFARVTRFQALLDAMNARPRPEWSAIAVRLGYYDQAHMIGEFRRSAGMAPGRFLAARAAVQRA